MGDVHVGGILAHTGHLWDRPIRMTGVRPSDEDLARELCEIYGIHDDCGCTDEATDA